MSTMSLVKMTIDYTLAMTTYFTTFKFKSCDPLLAMANIITVAAICSALGMFYQAERMHHEAYSLALHWISPDLARMRDIIHLIHTDVSYQAMHEFHAFVMTARDKLPCNNRGHNKDFYLNMIVLLAFAEIY